MEWMLRWMDPAQRPGINTGVGAWGSLIAQRANLNPGAQRPELPTPGRPDMLRAASCCSEAGSLLRLPIPLKRPPAAGLVTFVDFVGAVGAVRDSTTT